MSRRSLLLLAGVGTASATGAYTTGAFDAVAGDRELDIATAGDDTALLGIDTTDRDEREGFDGETVTLFGVTNRFGSDLTSIEADIVDGVDGPVNPNSLETPTRTLQPGESGVIEGQLDCSRALEQTIEVSISASSPEQAVELTRPVEVRCIPRPVPEFVFADGPEAVGDPPDRVEFTVANEGDTVDVGGFRLEITDAPPGNEPDSFDEFDVSGETGLDGGDLGDEILHDPIEIGENTPYTIRTFRDEDGNESNMRSVLRTGELTVTLLDPDGEEWGNVEESD